MNKISIYFNDNTYQIITNKIYSFLSNYVKDSDIQDKHSFLKEFKEYNKQEKFMSAYWTTIRIKTKERPGEFWGTLSYGETDKLLHGIQRFYKGGSIRVGSWLRDMQRGE